MTTTDFTASIYLSSKLEKLTVVLSLLSLSSAGLIAGLTSKSIRYDVSIYNAYPAYFWALVVVTLTLAFGVIIYNAIYRETYITILPFCVVVGTLLLVLLLPISREYFLLGRGDVITNLGRAKHIFQTGHNPPRIIYPLPHIYVASIAHLTTISLNKVTMLAPVLVYCAYCHVVLGLSKRLSRRRLQSIIILMLAVLPIYGTDPTRFTSWAMTFFFIPTAVLSFLFLLDGRKKKIREYTALFAVCTIAALLGHPINGIMLLLIYLIIIFLRTDLTPPNIEEISGNYVYYFGAIVVTYFIWYFSMSVIQGLFARELKYLFQGQGSTEASVYSGFLGQFDLLYLLEVFFWRFAPVIILTGLAGISALAYLSEYSFSDMDENVKPFLALVGVFTLLSPASNFWIASQLYRLDRFNLFVCAIFIGLAGGYILATKVSKRQAFATVMALLVVLSAVTMLSVYRNPEVKNPGRQVTTTEYRTMAWIINHNSDMKPIDAFGLSAERYHRAIYGERTDVYPDEATPPPHFGYNSHDSVRDSYDSRRYLLISGMTRDYYRVNFPNRPGYWKFSPEDIKKLDTDNGANRVFDSKETVVYSI